MKMKGKIRRGARAGRLVWRGCHLLAACFVLFFIIMLVPEPARYSSVYGVSGAEKQSAYALNPPVSERMNHDKGVHDSGSSLSATSADEFASLRGSAVKDKAPAGTYELTRDERRPAGSKDEARFATELHSLARRARAQGNLDQARRYIEAALLITDSMRHNIGSREMRASYFAETQTFYEFQIDLLMQLHGRRPGEGFERAAFEANERARTREFSELLANRHVRARESIDDGSPGVTVTAARPLSVEEVQTRVVADDTLLLEYALGTERSYLWAITRGEIEGYELPQRATIESLAREVYKLLTARQTLEGETAAQHRRRVETAEASYEPRAAELSHMLLGPVARQLGTKRLLIVGQGALQSIPFEALPAPSSLDADGVARPLFVDHVIEYLPSASVLELLRRETISRKPTSKIVAVFADPVFETDDPRISEPAVARLRSFPAKDEGFAMPRLLGTREEAEAIMATVPADQRMVALGFAASRDAALSVDLSKYRIIHFATHGLINTEHPEMSGITLSSVDEQGRQRDGFLTQHDIYGLQLSADLVVLSACETGLGNDVKGEGIVGFSQSFMHAGAHSVVTSLWKVDDMATADLMARFYQGMLRDGLTPAAALREAKVGMWQQGRWRHPYYWAGFILQGDGSRSSKPTTEDTKYSHVFVAALLPIGLSLIGACLRRRHHQKLSQY